MRNSTSKRPRNLPSRRKRRPCRPLLEGLEARRLLATNITQYHVDSQSTGANLTETQLTPSNVNQSTFGKQFSYPLDGLTFASPLYVPNVNIPGQGYRNVVYVATEHDSVYAFDADSKSNSDPIWVQHFGGSVPTSLFCDGTRRDIRNEIGVVSTPVISFSRHALRVDGKNYLVGREKVADSPLTSLARAGKTRRSAVRSTV